MSQGVDVVIVGARCAGSAAATVFGRLGLRVLMLDKSSLPSEALSSHTLFSGTVDEFDRLDATRYLHRVDPPDLRGMTIHTQRGTDSATFNEMLPPGLVGTVTSARRYLLDQALLECALDAGAEVRTESRVESVIWRGGRAAGVRYRSGEDLVTVGAKLVVGADGQFSTMADLLGAGEPTRWSYSPRAAMLRYLVDPVTEEPEASTVHHSRNGSSLAFSFPTAPRGQTVVMFIDALSVIDAARRDPETLWQQTLMRHPLMHARYAGATEMEPVRFHDDHMSYFRPATGPGWTLIGDAGHFKNPIIGQGIRDALWAGRTMAERAGPLLDRPAELDVTLRTWERERERECRLAYLSGLMEARTMGDSAGILDLVAALDRHQVPIVDAFGRRGPGLYHRYAKGAILRAAVDAVRGSKAPARTLADLGELALGFAARAVALHRQPFRGRTPNLWECPVPVDHRPAGVP